MLGSSMRKFILGTHKKFAGRRFTCFYGSHKRLPPSIDGFGDPESQHWGEAIFRQGLAIEQQRQAEINRDQGW